MGEKFVFKCTNCDYEVLSSGERDYGMLAIVAPYICNDCLIVTDVLIGEFGKDIPPEFLDEKQKKEYYCCTNCSGKNINKWDIQEKPCSKCGSRMKKNSVIPEILWD